MKSSQDFLPSITSLFVADRIGSTITWPLAPERRQFRWRLVNDLWATFATLEIYRQIASMQSDWSRWPVKCLPPTAKLFRQPAIETLCSVQLSNMRNNISYNWPALLRWQMKMLISPWPRSPQSMIFYLCSWIHLLGAPLIILPRHLQMFSSVESIVHSIFLVEFGRVHDFLWTMVNSVIDLLLLFDWSLK